MKISYTIEKNCHSTEGAGVALAAIFGEDFPKSFLDVGCGPGTWLVAARAAGVTDLYGVDGLPDPATILASQNAGFMQIDLTSDWNLNRRFDAAICLEVAEHLPSSAGSKLVKNIANHADLVVFSAASPLQAGDHHLTCEWPAYWQGLFNSAGFWCEDSVRWKLWNDRRVEPWYRQNLFICRKDSRKAGTEPRIRPVYHPEIAPSEKGLGHFDYMTLLHSMIKETLRRLRRIPGRLVPRTHCGSPEGSI